MKKILFMFACCVLCLCGCTNNQKADFNYTNEEQIEKEIATDMEQIAEVQIKHHLILMIIQKMNIIRIL